MLVAFTAIAMEILLRIIIFLAARGFIFPTIDSEAYLDEGHISRWPILPPTHHLVFVTRVSLSDVCLVDFDDCAVPPLVVIQDLDLFPHLR